MSLTPRIDALDQPADVELYLDTGDGHGSTATKIRKYANIRKQTGQGVYYNYQTNSADGMSVTILIPGLYEVFVQDQANAAVVVKFGISVDASSLTTDINFLTYTQGSRAWVIPDNESGFTGAVTKILRLNAGQVVRVHTNGSSNFTTDASARFSLIRLGP